MNNFNDPSRLGGTPHRTAPDDLTLPIESGVLPEDFPHRIVRLKEASGLSWRGMARALGVDSKQLRRWRRGVEPGGGAHALPPALRQPRPRRRPDPHGRRVPDDPVQGR